MYCNKCGQHLPENSCFCNKCGTDLKNALHISGMQSSAISSEQKPKKTHFLPLFIKKASGHIGSNLLISTCSAVALYFSITNLREAYDQIIRIQKLIEIEKELVDLSIAIRGNATIAEANLEKSTSKLYYSIAETVLYGAIILVAVVILFIFISKLLTLFRGKNKISLGGE